MAATTKKHPGASLLLASLICVAPGAGHAEVSAEEAARLGAELTRLGAERDGNADGSIPEWTGGITQPPDDHVAGQFHTDPFAEDEPLFTITAENADEFAEHLSDGHRGLLRTYPETWRMPVYPTHRSASYPEWVTDAVRDNATRARVVLEGRGTVIDSKVSSPFPIPQSGVEVIWNHTMRWRGVFVRRSQGTAAVTRRGNYSVVLSMQEIGLPYGSRTETSLRSRYPNVLFAAKSRLIEPALVAGNGSLVIEPLDQTRSPRKTWTYSQALRRVLRAPHVAYDFPSANSDGLRTVDDVDMFIGPPDRFEWTLRGKRELYVPYNAYRLHGGELRASDILAVGHIEPSLTRYERHRVWVVEGVLQPGKKHIYGRRVYYVDEDSWQILVAELYDHDGQLWRVADAHVVNFYEVPLLWTTLEVYHDLKARRFFATGLDNSRRPPDYAGEGNPREFSPNALSYYVR